MLFNLAGKRYFRVGDSRAGDETEWRRFTALPSPIGDLSNLCDSGFEVDIGHSPTLSSACQLLLECGHRARRCEARQ